jgi:hypothetical protein
VLNSESLPNRELDVTIARETDIFLEVSPRRLTSAGRFGREAADGPRTKDRIKMSDRPSHNLGGLDIGMARRIDQVCRRFEADWRAGRRPRIEDYVVDVSHEGRPALRAELEALEGELRPSEETLARPAAGPPTAPEPPTAPLRGRVSKAPDPWSSTLLHRP